MHYSVFSIVMYGETKLAVSQEQKRKSKTLFYFFLVRSRATCTCKKSSLETLPTVLNIRLHFIILFKYFFFQATYTLSRKIVRNRAVSSYRGVCKKKKTCALSGI